MVRTEIASARTKVDALTDRMARNRRDLETAAAARADAAGRFDQASRADAELAACLAGLDRDVNVAAAARDDFAARNAAQANATRRAADEDDASHRALSAALQTAEDAFMHEPPTQARLHRMEDAREAMEAASDRVYAALAKDPEYQALLADIRRQRADVDRLQKLRSVPEAELDVAIEAWNDARRRVAAATALALDRDPQYVQARNDYAVARKQHEDALADFRAALANDPQIIALRTRADGTAANLTSARQAENRSIDDLAHASQNLSNLVARRDDVGGRFQRTRQERERLATALGDADRCVAALQRELDCTVVELNAAQAALVDACRKLAALP